MAEIFANRPTTSQLLGRFRTAYLTLFLLAAVNVAAGAAVEFRLLHFEPRFAVSLTLSIDGLVLLVLAYFVTRQSAIALGLAIALVAVGWNAGGLIASIANRLIAEVASLLIAISSLVFLVRGFIALRALKRSHREVLASDRISLGGWRAIAPGVAVLLVGIIPVARHLPTLGQEVSSAVSNRPPIEKVGCPVSGATKTSGKPQTLIAFMNDRDGNLNNGNGDQTIYVIGQDGCSLRQLTNSGADDDEAAWSPDGRLIAFTRQQGASLQIHVINADGTGAQGLTDERDNSNPVWSPDGSTIAFASDRNGHSEIFLMNPDGSQQRPLSVAAPGWQPAWSPDGQRIAFVSNRDGQQKIYVMNADGSGQTQLTSQHGEHPAWSPDGTKIVFWSKRDHHNEIYVMNADGTGQTKLTQNPGGNGNPSWSPDGRLIAFESDQGGQFEVYVMNADGTGQRQLTSLAGGNASPVWGP